MRKIKKFQAASLILIMAMMSGLLVAAFPALDASAESNTIPAESIIQDPAFYDYMIGVLGKASGDIITADDVSGIRSINVSNLGIAELTGINYFTALEELDCSENELTELDMSDNPALRYLACSDNSLTVLDVTNNLLLEKLACYYNRLTELDVTGNPLLVELLCSGNKLTELDVTQNPALEFLSCFGNKLTELDVTQNPVLKFLACSTNELAELDVTNNLALTELDCSENKLTELDVTKNPALEELWCSSNKLAELDVTHNPALKKLGCDYNSLTVLDVSHNLELTELFCSENELTELDVANNLVLVKLECARNGLTDIDISGNLNLARLNCRGNDLTLVDVTKNNELNYIDCTYNYIKFIDDVIGWRDNSKLIVGETFIYDPQNIVDAPPSSVEEFVIRLYENVLMRPADYEGQEEWTEKLTQGEVTGAEIAFEFYFSVEFLTRDISNEEYILNLYRTMLGRIAEEEGKNHWLSILNEGMSRIDMLAEFVICEEFSDLCEAAGIIVGEVKPLQETYVRAFVWRFYYLCLGRAPDEYGLIEWTRRLVDGEYTGAQIAWEFVFFEEMVNRELSNEDFVIALYNTMLGRMPDAAGSEAWTECLNRNMSRERLFEEFAISEEFGNVCDAHEILR